MPQSKDTKREQARIRKQRQRDKERDIVSVTTGGVTGQNDVTQQDVAVEMFEGKPRYLTLSDGQVFDRTYQPEPNKHIPEMIACNRSDALRLRGRLL